MGGGCALTHGACTHGDVRFGTQGIIRGSERLDQFRLAMSWNQEELEQWAAAQRAKEEDNAAVEEYKYARMGGLTQGLLVRAKAVVWAVGVEAGLRGLEAGSRGYTASPSS